MIRRRGESGRRTTDSDSDWLTGPLPTRQLPARTLQHLLAAPLLAANDPLRFPWRLPATTASSRSASWALLQVRAEKTPADRPRDPGMRGESCRQPCQIAGLPLETGQPARLKAVEIDQIDGRVAGFFDHEQIGGLEIAMGGAGRMHPPEQPAQCLGASRGDAKSRGERPLRRFASRRDAGSPRRRSTG